MSASELAGPTGTHAQTLRWLMRSLAGFGVLTEGPGQRFALTPIGETLHSNSPGKARSAVLMLGGDWAWQSLAPMMDCLSNGGTGVEKALGQPLFDFLADHPEESTIFNDAMIGFHGAEPAAVTEAYDFPAFETVVYVGGGTGNLLTTGLGRHGGPRGILHDLPHVLDKASGIIDARGLTDRINFEVGSFFERPPSGGDAFMLSHIIHD